MGKHKDETSDEEFSVESLIAAIQNVVGKAHVEVVNLSELGHTHDSAKIKSKKFPGTSSRWGGTDHLKSEDGRPVPHLANVLVDAAESDRPVQLLLNNGKTLIGRVLSVSAEIFCVELWDKKDEGTEFFALTRPSEPQQAYIDLAAVDALIDIPGDWEGPDEDPDRTKDLSGEEV